MTKFRKLVGKNIKELRQLASLSQADLAHKIGVSDKTISYWENGHNAISYDSIPLLAQALDVPEYKLFVFGDLACRNNEESLNLLNSLTEKEKNIISKIINNVLMLR